MGWLHPAPGETCPTARNARGLLCCPLPLLPCPGRCWVPATSSLQALVVPVLCPSSWCPQGGESSVMSPVKQQTWASLITPQPLSSLGLGAGRLEEMASGLCALPFPHSLAAAHALPAALGSCAPRQGLSSVLARSLFHEEPEFGL